MLKMCLLLHAHFGTYCRRKKQIKKRHRHRITRDLTFALVPLGFWHWSLMHTRFPFFTSFLGNELSSRARRGCLLFFSHFRFRVWVQKVGNSTIKSLRHCPPPHVSSEARLLIGFSLAIAASHRAAYFLRAIAEIVEMRRPNIEKA